MKNSDVWKAVACIGMMGMCTCLKERPRSSAESRGMREQVAGVRLESEELGLLRSSIER